MEIRNIKHKGLKNFVEKGQAKGLPSQQIDKIKDIVLFLLDTEDIDEFITFPKYKPYCLTGDRTGTYSMSITANWRLTFLYDVDENEIYDLDLEDYH